MRARASTPPAVARVLERIVSTARAHSMFQPGTTVVVAVSGGPDSLCLLNALYRLRGLFGVELACFHFDHGLRSGSHRDATYVRSHADRLGVPCFVRRATGSPPRGASVEAWARSQRYEALRSVRRTVGARSAAVGHTADDQAETVLLALIRGGGLEALSGMRPVREDLVRPLIEVGREETVTYCRSLGFRPREDPMNSDPSYLRVGVRSHVVPVLEERLGRNLRATINRTASLIAEDAEFLDRLADAAASGVVVRDPDGIRLVASALAELPKPLGARVVRRATLEMGVHSEASHADALLSLATREPGRRIDLPGGLLAERDKEYVRLSRPSPAFAPRERRKPGQGQSGVREQDLRRRGASGYAGQRG